MPYLVTITLKDGKALSREIPDDETLDRELRFIDRLRRARWGFPVISWPTVDGQRWCVAATDIAGDLDVRQAQPVKAVIS